MSFLNFLGGWQTAKDEEQRKREEEARRALAAQERLQRNQDRLIDDDFARRDANKRILNTSKITSRLFGGESSDTPEKDIGVVSLGLRLRDYNRKQEREKAEALSRAWDRPGLLDKGWDVLNRYSEAGELIGGQPLHDIKQTTRELFELPERVMELAVDPRRRQRPTSREQAISQFGRQTTGLFNPDYQTNPEEWKTAVRSVLGDDQAREETKKALEDLNIDERIIGSLIVDATNLLPGIGFVDPVRYRQAISAVRAGGKALLESEQGMKFVRGLRLLHEGEIGGTRIRKGAKATADVIQDALDFGEKVRLQKLGIDPQAIDDPAVLARIQDEAPDIAAKLGKSATIDDLAVRHWEDIVGATPSRKVLGKSLKPPQSKLDIENQLSDLDDELSHIDDLMAETESEARLEKLQERYDELDEYKSGLEDVLGEVESSAEEFAGAPPAVRLNKYGEPWVSPDDIFKGRPTSEYVTPESSLPKWQQDQLALPPPREQLLLEQSRQVAKVPESGERGFNTAEGLAYRTQAIPATDGEQLLLEQTRAIVTRAETGWETPEGLRYLTNPTPDNLIEFTATAKAQAEIVGDEASIRAWKKGELLLEKHGEITALTRAEAEIDDVIKYGDDAAKTAAREEQRVIRQKLDNIRAELHSAMNALEPPKSVDEEILRNGMIQPEGAFERLYAKVSIKPFISGFTSRFSRANYFANRMGGQILNGAKTELTTQATRLEMELMSKVRQNGDPFKLVDGVEQRTGIHIGDIIEQWDEIGKRFVDDPDYDKMNAYVNAAEDARKTVLKTLSERYGVDVNEAWQEMRHAFRQVTGIEGLDASKVINDGIASAKPGSLKQRAYETVAQGLAEGRRYEGDYTALLDDSLNSLLEYGVRHWATKQFKDTLGTRVLSLVNIQYREAVQDAAHEYEWAKRLQDYASGSLHGTPSEVRYRTTKTGLAPDAFITDRTKKITELARSLDGEARAQAIRPHLKEIDDYVVAKRVEVKRLGKEYKTEADHLLNAKVRPGHDLPDAALASARRVRSGKFAGQYQVSTGPISVPELTKTLFTAEDAKFVETFFGRSDALTEAITRVGGRAMHGWESWVGNSVRLLQTGIDAGFIFLHGLGSLALDLQAAIRNPKRLAQPHKSIWVRSVVEGTISMFNPANAQARLAKQAQMYPEEMASFQRFVGKWNTTEKGIEVVEALGDAGVVGKIPILREIPRTLSRGMASFLNYSMWEAWKVLNKYAKGEDQLAQMGLHIRNMMGNYSYERAGIGGFQKQFERTFGFYSGSMTRSAASIMAKAATAPDTYGGRLAAQGLAAYLSVGTGLVAGIALLTHAANSGKLDPAQWKLSEIPKETLEALNPFGGKFMSVKQGENYSGIGGPMRSNFKWLALSTKQTYEAHGTNLNPYDPETTLNLNNPFVRLWRSKGPWTTGTAFNVITGEDYLGHQNDNFGDALLGSSEDAGPFWFNAGIEARGDTVDKVVAGVQSSLGFNTYPMSPYQVLDEKAFKAFGVPYADVADEDGGQPNLLQEVKFGMHNDNPDYKAVYDAWAEYENDQRAKGNKKQELRDRKASYRTGTAAVTAENEIAALRWNAPGGGEDYDAAMPVIGAGIHNEGVRLQEELGIEFPDDEDKQDSLYSQWLAAGDYKLYGSIDDPKTYDLMKAAQLRIENQMSPEERRALKNPSRKWPENPLIAATEMRRIDAAEARNKWFDTSKYVGVTPEQSKQIDELIAKAQELASEWDESPQYFIRKAAAGQYSEEIIAAARAVANPWTRDRVTSPKRDQWLMAHPDLVVFNSWMLDTLTDYDAQKMLELLRNNR